MVIAPLAEDTLSAAVSLVRKVFSENKLDEIPASLHPEQYGNFFSEAGILPGLKYWVALNSGEVAGIVGLYNYQTDPQDTVWLGWFCVKPAVRRRGIGTELLRFAVGEARKRGKHFLKLYTSTDPNEINSHRLYKKHGFGLIGREPYPGAIEGVEKLYFELSLTNYVDML